MCVGGVESPVFTPTLVSVEYQIKCQPLHCTQSRALQNSEVLPGVKLIGLIIFTVIATIGAWHYSQQWESHRTANQCVSTACRHYGKHGTCHAT